MKNALLLIASHALVHVIETLIALQPSGPVAALLEDGSVFVAA